MYKLKKFGQEKMAVTTLILTVSFKWYTWKINLDAEIDFLAISWHLSAAYAHAQDQTIGFSFSALQKKRIFMLFFIKERNKFIVIKGVIWLWCMVFCVINHELTSKQTNKPTDKQSSKIECKSKFLRADDIVAVICVFLQFPRMEGAVL